MPDVTTRNLLFLTTAGAFTAQRRPEQMSVFKWRQLCKLAEAHKVLTFVLAGVERHARDERMNMPTEVLEQLRKLNAENHVPPLPIEQVRLHNPWLNFKLHRILYNEHHSIDTSVETIHLLRLILFNIESLLTRGVSMQGLISLGSFLRTMGHKADFVKLDSWLPRLHLQRMADYVGSLLVAGFCFEEEELPFMKRLLTEAAPRSFGATYFKKPFLHVTEPHSAGFIRTHFSAFMRGIKCAFAHLSHAPLEASSCLMHHCLRSFLEIEE